MELITEYAEADAPQTPNHDTEGSLETLHLISPHFRFAVESFLILTGLEGNATLGLRPPSASAVNRGNNDEHKGGSREEQQIDPVTRIQAAPRVSSSNTEQSIPASTLLLSSSGTTKDSSPTAPAPNDVDASTIKHINTRTGDADEEIVDDRSPAPQPPPQATQSSTTSSLLESASMPNLSSGTR